MSLSVSPPPSELYAELFSQVQEAALFADSKTFADADPRRDPAAILADWHRDPPRDPAAMRAFVHANFLLPGPDNAVPLNWQPLTQHISALWPMLTREPQQPPPGSSLLPLPRPHVVPGGRFRELYYWDSYFTMLGLARSGRQDLVEDMVVNFGSLLDRFDRIPNGTRNYYLGRSHPPVFYLIASLSQDQSVDARRRRLRWMMAEHRFWMACAGDLAPGNEAGRVVRLADGALLNRYWDDHTAPRDESWREDIALARETPGRVAAELWRDLRAAAESGWDFSSRWLGDRRSLGTIRTTRLLPVDLNALLYGLEDMVAREADTLGDPQTATLFATYAAARRRAIASHLWNAGSGFYADFDLDVAAPSDQPTAAMVFPLFTGAAEPGRASSTATALAALVGQGGLLTTLDRTGQQWDAPNGWAPLQWIAVKGLENYGEQALADQIALRWLTTVGDHYREAGRLLEKYDVEKGGAGGGGEYASQTGFGWTNGVTLELLARSAMSDPGTDHCSL
ncbi:MAG: alpha,alpha-trehalase TreA [Sphingomonas sp.]|uniref:alpha,alpha-trehalase TreA n=1 Tax=Sphingomonas sp. TaxID=28214 RepID=UPI001AD19775|nr:alpha,alpha-trehalase TreA [Sphingomonas sp.]MBN8816220.1 alpha,alpha-trehalase TreA [Sphingomonas sp.]